MRRRVGTRLLGFLLCFVVLGSPPPGQCRGKAAAGTPVTDRSAFEREIRQLAVEWSIPGMSIAVIRDGEIVWHDAFGVKNAGTREPVDENTVFDAASLTKPLFAYFTMLMVDRGVIGLDTPLVDYLSKEKRDGYFGRFGYAVDQPGFRADWFTAITPRHVLSHSAGLPHGEIHEGKKPKVYPLFSAPGTQFKYSAEGYFILQFIFEDLLGQRLDVLMDTHVFQPLQMSHSAMVWDEKMAGNAAFGHSVIGRPSAALRQATVPHAGGSLYTTAGDYARFVVAVLDGKGLSSASRAAMRNPIVAIEPGLAAAPGFALEESAAGTCLWHTGDWGAFRNFAMADVESKSAVVYLANSFYGLSIYDKVVDMVFGGGHPLVRCEFLQYYRSLDDCRQVLNDVDAAITHFSRPEFKESPEFSHIEFRLDFIAHEFLRANQVANAIKLCRYNTTTFPQSAPAWASLGEAYAQNGQGELARTAYEKALLIDPGHEAAGAALRKLHEQE